jgi:type II secretory pathway component PulK
MNFANYSYRRRRRDRQGYVLVMTLVLILLAALAQAGLARRSLQLASEAVEAQSELQRRWGTVSCRRYLLANPEERFLLLEQEHRKEGRPWPVPSKITQQVVLGKLSFTLSLDDEEAKLNLNTLQSRLPERFREVVHQLTGGIIPLQLLPNQTDDAVRSRRWYQSWGQVFPLGEVFATQGLKSLLAATSHMTCWGTGKLNIKRVTDELLTTVVTQEIDAKTARELVDARQASGEIEFDSLLAQLSLRRSQAAKLRAWFTDESQCYSLWIEIADSKRKWYHQFVIGDRGTPAELPYLAFHW